jgi:hypothetical protein
MKPTPWKMLNPSELEFFKTSCARRGWFPSDFTLENLQTRPVARVLYWWKERGGYGLSPFALAGITRHSPGEVVEQAEKEKCAGTYIDFCPDTKLPILFSGDPTYRTTRELENSYDFTLGSYEDLEQNEDDEERDYYLGEKSWDSLMEAYGGPDYLKYCTRKFDPFEVGRRNHIATSTWLDLREAYLGKSLRRKKVA